MLYMKRRTHITITDRSSWSTASVYFLPVRKATTASHKCHHVLLLCWRAKHFLSSPGLIILIKQNKLFFIKVSCYQWSHPSDVGDFPSICKEPRKWSTLSSARVTPILFTACCLLSPTYDTSSPMCFQYEGHSYEASLLFSACIVTCWVNQSCADIMIRISTANVTLLFVSYFRLLMGMQPILSNWTSTGL